MKGGCIVYEDGKPRMLREGVPDVRTMYFPMHAIRLHDNWYASGLCGTGSCDMTVEALRVPEGHTLSMISDKPWCDGPLYRFPLFGLLAIGCGAVALGVARGAIEDIRELAGAKTPTLSRRTLAERAQTQADVAKAEAQVASARAWLHEEIGKNWDAAARGDAIPLERRSALRLASTHAVDASVRAVDACYTLGGGTSVYRASSLQRRFRDVHVITQHMMVAAPTYELAGPHPARPAGGRQHGVRSVMLPSLPRASSGGSARPGGRELTGVDARRWAVRHRRAEALFPPPGPASPFGLRRSTLPAASREGGLEVALRTDGSRPLVRIIDHLQKRRRRRLVRRPLRVEVLQRLRGHHLRFALALVEELFDALVR